MMNLQLVPVFIRGSANNAEAPAKRPRKFLDTLNEAVVLIFFILGPIVGAVIFLMWFGGLTWGVIWSFFR
jgi:hypothetical protein